jgi:hypothetical protein
MTSRFVRALFFFACVSPAFQAFAMNIDDPFGKVESVAIGKDVAWDIDKDARKASKTTEHKGTYYHLEFDNRQIVVRMTSDAAGNQPKSFTQLEVKNLSIDGEQSPLFMWCLNNQARHSRFLQQGLTVKKDICSVDGGAGKFVMKLNKATLESLLASKRMAIELKPYRTPLELKYDMSDFEDMNIALNARPAPAVVPEQVAESPKPAKKCWAGPPAQYKNIKPVEYDCDDATARKDAEAWVSKLVVKEQEKEKQLAAERERQRKLAEEKKKKEMEAKLALEKQQAAEAAAIAASQAKQAEITSEITEKMVGVCSKFWDKGEHRCYCQKYISYAPADIQANSTCQ